MCMGIVWLQLPNIHRTILWDKLKTPATLSSIAQCVLPRYQYIVEYLRYQQWWERFQVRRYLDLDMKRFWVWGSIFSKSYFYNLAS